MSRTISAKKYEKLAKDIAYLKRIVNDPMCAVCRTRPRLVRPSGSVSVTCGQGTCPRRWLFPDELGSCIRCGNLNIKRVIGKDDDQKGKCYHCAVCKSTYHHREKTSFIEEPEYD